MPNWWFVGWVLAPLAAVGALTLAVLGARLVLFAWDLLTEWGEDL